jgi:Flp pilus assembly pilin Flp
VSDFVNNLVVRAYLAVKREEGQTFVEYSLIAGIIGVLLIAGLAGFRGQIETALTDVGNKL